MRQASPDHRTWAVELLTLRPSHRVLEVGCGSGVAASLIASRLPRGRLLTLDRSPAQARAAAARCREGVAAGRVEVRRAELAEADLGAARFHRILAVDVNLFWTDGAPEARRLREVLAPRGRLVLVFRPPSADKAGAVAARCAENLAAAGFRGIRTRFHDFPGGRAAAVTAGR